MLQSYLKKTSILGAVIILRAKFKDREQIPPIKIRQNFKKDFFGTSPAPFIGRYGYPEVHIGVLSPQLEGDTSHYDSPRLWSQKALPLGTIASMRYGLVNSRTSWNVKDARRRGKFLDVCQEVGKSSKAVEMEIHLKEPPLLPLKPEKEIIPFGPQGEIIRARVTSNPKVDSRVERVVSDTDLKAAPAIISLYQKGFEESFLNKLLSVGNVGIKKNRILVPTRWSITAVDDTIGKQLIAEIKDLPIGEYCLYFGGNWGNYYLLLFFPEVWSYELFETYVAPKINPWSKKGNFYSTDYESYQGRKGYAEETAGGYYACRLAVLEKMKELKRQQACLALRFITSEYNIPLGVWVCREAARRSAQEKPLFFSSLDLIVQYATELVKNKFGFDIGILLKESILLKKKNEQRKLMEFYPE